MSYRVLEAEEASWRPSNQMGVLNTDLAKQLEASTLGARLWRLQPGQASTRHRHRHTHELYVLLEGTGRIRIGEVLHTLKPLSSLLVDPELITERDARVRTQRRRASAWTIARRWRSKFEGWRCCREPARPAGCLEVGYRSHFLPFIWISGTSPAVARPAGEVSRLE